MVTLCVAGGAFDKFRDSALHWKLQMRSLPKAAAHPEPIAQEANIRLVHRYLGYSMVDLHNQADFQASFTYKYYGLSQLSVARGLCIWLLRERQIQFKRERNARPDCGPPLTCVRRGGRCACSDEALLGCHR